MAVAPRYWARWACGVEVLTQQSRPRLPYGLGFRSARDTQAGPEALTLHSLARDVRRAMGRLLAPRLNQQPPPHFVPFELLLCEFKAPPALRVELEL